MRIFRRTRRLRPTDREPYMNPITRAVARAKAEARRSETDPNPEYSRLDRLDGLPRRQAAPKWVDLFGIDPGFTGDATTDEYLATGRTRYDDQWPDAIAAEVDPALAAMQEKVNETWARRAAAAASIGGDLAAMAAPAVGWTWTGSGGGGGVAAMAAPGDWPVWDYGEGYEIEPEERVVVHRGSVAGCALCADPSDLPMVRAAATAYDLGLPAPLRSDPPIYRACLGLHGSGW